MTTETYNQEILLLLKKSGVLGLPLTDEQFCQRVVVALEPGLNALAETLWASHPNNPKNILPIEIKKP